jgi:hypothetical protein
MSKVEMAKLGFKSPNKADAISMTFLRKDGERRSIFGDMPGTPGADEFDPHSTMD